VVDVTVLITVVTPLSVMRSPASDTVTAGRLKVDAGRVIFWMMVETSAVTTLSRVETTGGAVTVIAGKET